MGYDAANRLIGVTDWLGNHTAYSYDAAGNRTATGYPSGASFSYDAADRLVGLLHTQPGGAAIAGYSLTRDPVGNPTAIDGNAGISPVLTSLSETAGYDAANQLTAINAELVGHDANGNQTATAAHSYTYDAADHLVAIDAGVTAQYACDGLGRRLIATRGVATRRYSLDVAGTLSQVLIEGDALGNPIAYYVRGAGLLARITLTGAVSYYHHDPQGHTVALTNAAGAVTDAYAYGPFGEPQGAQGSTANPVRFLGQWGVHEEGNGLVHIRARSYDPAQGRFISPDPLRGQIAAPQTLNRYAYGLNNPIRFVDVSGLSAREGRVLGAFTGSSDYIQNSSLASMVSDKDARNQLIQTVAEITREYSWLLMTGLVDSSAGIIIYWGYEILGHIAEALEEWEPVIDDMNDMAEGAEPKTWGGSTIKAAKCDFDLDCICGE
jgi:RHS repeat-associated protein